MTGSLLHVIIKLKAGEYTNAVKLMLSTEKPYVYFTLVSGMVHGLQVEPENATFQLSPSDKF